MLVVTCLCWCCLLGFVCVDACGLWCLCCVVLLVCVVLGVVLVCVVRLSCACDVDC